MDRLRDMRKENVEFSKKVDQFNLDNEQERNRNSNVLEKEPPSAHDLEVISIWPVGSI